MTTSKNTKSRQQRYRDRRKIISLYFSVEEGQAIVSQAAQHNLKPADYIKSLVKQEVPSLYVPAVSDAVKQEILTEIRRIATNINQLVRHIHSYNRIDERDISGINERLQHLETFIKQQTYALQPVTVYLDHILAQHPDKHWDIVRYIFEKQ